MRAHGPAGRPDPRTEAREERDDPRPHLHGLRDRGRRGRLHGRLLHDSLCVINIKIKAKVIAPSAYSGKDVVLNLDFADIIQISDEDEDDEELFYEKDMIFEIDPYVISLIVGEVPMVVTLKDEKLPEDGKGYRILTEDEYLEEQKSKTDPRWSKLDDIDLD